MGMILKMGIDILGVDKGFPFVASFGVRMRKRKMERFVQMPMPAKCLKEGLILNLPQTCIHVAEQGKGFFSKDISP